MSSQAPSTAVCAQRATTCGPGEREAPGSHHRLVSNAHLGAPLQSPGPGGVGAGMRSTPCTERSCSSYLVAQGTCVEIVLTLAVNSSFSPHLSHSFSFSISVACSPAGSLGWAGRSCSGARQGAREDAACLKLPGGHRKVREQNRPNSTHFCCCLKFLLSWKTPAGPSRWNPAEKHGAFGRADEMKVVQGIWICLFSFLERQ